MVALRSDQIPPVAEAPSPGVQPTRCLVVDDEPHLRRLLSRLMRSEGFQTEEAENGRVAQEALNREPATLVLTDLHMPELDGIGLLRHVRATYPDRSEERRVGKECRCRCALYR